MGETSAYKKIAILERFSACTLDGVIEWSFAQIGPFLPLPSLQVLEGYTLSDTNDGTEEEVLWDSPPACSSLKQVFLEYSSVNVRSAETLVRVAGTSNPLPSFQVARTQGQSNSPSPKLKRF